MARFALICPPFLSHVRVFEALAERLAARGHESAFVLNAGADRFVGAGVPVHCVGGAADLDAIIARAARPNGPLGILRTVADTARLTDALCRDAPSVLRRIGAEAVIGDQMEPAAGLIAAALALPFVSVAAALPVNRAPGIPLPFLGWPFDPSREGLKRNRGGERIAALLLRRQRRTVEGWAARLRLPPRSTLEDCLSPTLQIAQTVPGFDFPRPASGTFHAVGPIRAWARAQDAPLPFAVDPKRPLVFASLGTLQGHRAGIFRKIARACRRIGAQCVVAHCGKLSPRQAASIDADVVADFLPQEAVLARAAACVTHGGMNTVMDALGAGVPLLAIPIAFDQPGIAARIAYHRVGETLGRVTLSSGAIEASLRRLIASSEMRESARAIGREIAVSGGTALAADLIEEMLAARDDAGQGDRSAVA